MEHWQLIVSNRKNNTMNLNFSPEKMHELKIRLKKKYPQLTETDLQHKEGMEESMFRIVAYKLRKTKKEMQEIITRLFTVFQ